MKPRALSARIGGLLIAGAFMAALSLVIWSRTQPNADRAPVSIPEAAVQPAAEHSLDLERAMLQARQHPENPELAVEAGGLAGDQGQYAEALRWFRQAERINPRLVPAVTGQGQMWMKLQRPGRAAAAYGRALKLAPGEPQLLLELARAHTYLREFGEALDYVQQAEKKGGESPESCRARAYIYAGNVETAKSMEYAQRACRLAPSDPENWLTWGNLLVTNRKYQESEEPLRRALALNPAHVRANVALARALIEGRKTPAADREAFNYLARARTFAPADSEALLLQGQLVIRAGQLPLGTSLLRRAREGAPRDSAILLALGQALVRAGKGEEGVRLIRMGQTLGPRGVSFLDLEDLARKNPDPVIVERLAELYRRQELHDSAIRVLERALQRTPGEGRLQRKLKAIREELERRSPAIQDS